MHDLPPIIGPDVFFFFTWGARPPSDWGQPSPTTPHPLLGAAGRSAPAVLHSDLRPGALVLRGDKSLGLGCRWAFCRIWEYFGGIIDRELVLGQKDKKKEKGMQDF